MAQTQWITMNQQQAQTVLNQLSRHPDAIVFLRDVTEVSWRPLPFYSNYRLCRLINFATMPVFTMVYLTNGEDYIQLDGTANPIYTADEKDPVMINDQNVIPYLEFFFSNVQGSDGDVYILHDPHKIPFMETFSASQCQNIVETFRPLSVSFEPEDNIYKVRCEIHYGSSLMGTTISVSSDGKISFHEQSLLVPGIYFPDSPYNKTER